ncbi:hypothetical protein DICVIV_05496 [Dictyocaulus viviparus]|uniref:Uncharacterized protein n=1 Tax=Dictyocaulus viviparus TaxID=29172 RepID=A0A0D8Y1A7_DICVI|nr:hypothetical protein DICVIV_05496 [Dictyocaulus viviparus]
MDALMLTVRATVDYAHITSSALKNDVKCARSSVAYNVTSNSIPCKIANASFLAWHRVKTTCRDLRSIASMSYNNNITHR